MRAGKSPGPPRDRKAERARGRAPRGADLLGVLQWVFVYVPVIGVAAALVLGVAATIVVALAG